MLTFYLIKAKQAPFDYEAFAKFFAVADVLGNRHFLALENSRFYFNPSSNLIEPLGYDNQIIGNTASKKFVLNNEIFENELTISKEMFTPRESGRYTFLKIFFKDPNFLSKYFESLYSLSNENNFREFLNVNLEDFQNAELLLFKNFLVSICLVNMIQK